MITEKKEKIKRIADTISKVFVGKEEVIRVMLTGFISGLHVLIEDVPGVGKTTLARTLAAGVGHDFSRIQFTPDLLPGDVVGMTVWSQEKKDFIYKKGAIMHQFVLADEINRASPRTQSSLLEAMQEESVTVDGRTYRLPEPFFVVATQNPSDFIGTFHLPESELDRFGISFSIGYPHIDDEREILSRFQTESPLTGLESVTGPGEILQIRKLVRLIFVSDKVKGFIIEIANRTRSNQYVRLGASPRASRHLQLAAQARAFLEGREFVIPEDIVEVTVPVLVHRIILSSQARMEGRTPGDIIEKILRECKIPTGLS